MYVVQAYQFACTFELGVSATPPSISAQERYLLPQNKTLRPSTVVTQVLLTPRQTLALLLLAKYAHLDRIRARVEAKQWQEDARRSTQLNTPYMQHFRFKKPLFKVWTQPAPNHCPSRVSIQALDALAIFQDTTSIIDCEELGSTPEMRVRVMRLSRRWQARALGERSRLAKATARRWAQVWRTKALKSVERRREEATANKTCLRRENLFGQEDAQRSALLNTLYMQRFFFSIATLSSQRSGVNRVQERWMAAAEKSTGFNARALATRFAKSKEAKMERLQNVIEAAVRDPVVLAQNAFLAHFSQVRANAMPPSLKLCINPILATECVVAFVLLLSDHGMTST
jgi:hypothetical protein